VTVDLATRRTHECVYLLDNPATAGCHQRGHGANSGPPGPI